MADAYISIVGEATAFPLTLWPGSVIPARTGPDYAFEWADITNFDYNISDSISPWNGQSSDFLTNPARTGFSFT